MKRARTRLVSFIAILIMMFAPYPAHACILSGLQDLIDVFQDLFDPPLLPGYPAEDYWLGTSEEDYNRLGLSLEPEVWEDGLRTDPDTYSFEWWYVDAHFDDGTSVVIDFFTKPQTNPELPTTPAVYLSMSTPSGEVVEKSIYASVEDSSYSAAECNVQIGNNYIVGDLANYTIYVNDGEGTEVNLTLERTVPTWRPATGYSFFGDENTYFGWLPAVANGIARGTITHNGETWSVTGSGYHDHNWGNIDLSKHWKYWWWSRTQVGPYTIMATAQKLKNKYGNDTWQNIFVILDENGALIDATDEDVTMTFEESNFQFHLDSNYLKLIIAQTVTFRVDKENGDWAEIVINAKDLNISEDLLVSSGLSDAEILLARLLGKSPWYSNFSSTASLTYNIDGVEYCGEGIGTIEKMELE